MVVRMPLLRHGRSCKFLFDILQDVHDRDSRGGFAVSWIQCFLREQVVDEAECANAEESPCQITPNGGAIYCSNRLHPVIDSDAGNSVPSLCRPAVGCSKGSSTPVAVQVEGCHLSCGHCKPLYEDDPPDDFCAV